jgi:hypothetical protein
MHVRIITLFLYKNGITSYTYNDYYLVSYYLVHIGLAFVILYNVYKPAVSLF